MTKRQQTILILIEVLSASQQRQVLDLARNLSNQRLRGVKGSSLLDFVGSISAEDLALMQSDIEADCEQVEAHGW